MEYNAENWDLMVLEISKRFKVTADFDFMLFLIGIQELGQGMKPYERQEKMDLINLGKCTLLSEQGYLEAGGRDEEGWPQFKEVKSLKSLTPSFMNHLLKRAAYDYLKVQLQ
ncbi:hypothetical protein [Marinilabilia rubra]|uniref:Uncharacterized protein n=1 Tax=Marinilabilia rubra TaxID=2162893 RepID=A0A2U2BCZ8_9BACT|nr:hypothetical protein [Marinilabilia rubra]PWE00946.1 hypothetical protein DDZ16_00185 [Marinilabilia rubra]